jgi:hypothetical protein
MFEAYVVASDTSKDMSLFRHFCDRFYCAHDNSGRGRPYSTVKLFARLRG